MERHLDVLDDTIVAKVPPGAIARRGEGVGGNVQQRAVARIRNVDRGHRDCRRLAGAQAGLRKTVAGRLHRVWSRRYSAPASPALLLTAPMPASIWW